MLRDLANIVGGGLLGVFAALIFVAAMRMAERRRKPSLPGDFGDAAAGEAVGEIVDLPNPLKARAP